MELILLIAACTSSWNAVDLDGDGLTIADGDCWDDPTGPDGAADGAAIHPGALDAWYDGIDSDCAGDNDFDADGDGFVPEALVGRETLLVEGSGSLPGGDCWDLPDLLPGTMSPVAGLQLPEAREVHPGAAETWYDGIDADCAEDSDFDADADGHRSDSHPDARDTLGDDCDDSDAEINPDAVEAWYDGVDTDCLGDSDYDADGDGYDHVANGGTDCDDTDEAVHPGGLDTWYDGVDSDCGGEPDYDVDGDGYDSSDFGGADCDDANEEVNPEALDTWYDGFDSDCGGGSDYDADGDGYDSSDFGGTDCDDTTSTSWPGAPEAWYDGVDADCGGDSDYDADGDGHDALGLGEGTNDDCNDGDAEVSPTATETCSTDYDDDCDGDDDELDAGGCTPWYVDEDGDGYGSDGSVCTCTATGDYTASVDGDCLDSGSESGILAEEIHPDADEECDTVDNDCNGLVDEDDPGLTGLATWYLDADGDGYGDVSETMDLCEQPSGYVSNARDCDDDDEEVNPAADELCSTAGVDDDCDDEIDEDSAADATEWFGDGDGDGYGDATVSAISCDAPPDTVDNDTDCDDSDEEVNPAADELCSTEGVDDDCDGDVDEEDAADAATAYPDDDGDGYGNPSDGATSCSPPSDYVSDDSDCDDSDADVNPGEDEVCDADDIDEDCDGLADDEDSDALGSTASYPDSDGDGYGDDDVAATEYCDAPGGYVTDGSDCDDDDAGSHPGAPEVCDDADRDEDCDGLADDDDSSASGETTWYLDDDGDGYGGTSSLDLCDAPTDYMADGTDCDDGDSSVNPGADELCSTVGVDDDCDGSSDEATATDASTWCEDADLDGYGDPASTVDACSEPSGFVDDCGDCDDADDSVNADGIDLPGDGVDGDCSGSDEAALIYVAERSSGSVWAFERDTGDVAWSLDGFGSMIGLTVGTAGEIYVSRFTDEILSEIAADGSSSSNIAAGLTTPHALWFDPSTQTILMGTYTYGSVLEIDPSTGSTTVLISGMSMPISAVRRPGTDVLYIADRADDAVYSYDSTTSTLSLLATITGPNVVLPGEGDLLYVSSQGGGVYEVDASTGATTELWAISDPITGLCRDPGGDGLLMSDHNNDAIYYYEFSTGTSSTFQSYFDTPWQCASNVPADADGDGYYSLFFGGDDCDDADAGSYPGSGC